jgi:hypothetical protein
VKPEDIQEGDEADPEQHPIAIALRRQQGIDDARVSKRQVLIRRGDQWFRYGAPKRVLEDRPVAFSARWAPKKWGPPSGVMAAPCVKRR